MAPLLITGGAGFIGSHTVLVLLEAGHELVVLDNFANSSPLALDRVLELAPAGADQRLHVIDGDVRCAEDLDRAFAAAAAPITGVVHFAGRKAVRESVEQPLLYWDVNLGGTRSLADAMGRHGCDLVVFSSTATVYGEPEVFPLVETMPTPPVHPYAQTKLAAEQLLAAMVRSRGWRVTALRYFNPVGAHPTGRIGEDPDGIPNNLFPYITQVAAGRLERLRVFGDDYPTADGTGERDYLHVMDLAEAHAVALDHLLQRAEATQITLNLGTGRARSVLEVVQAFERATGIPIPYDVLPRRAGDVPKLEASVQAAAQLLGWQASRSLEQMCSDGWAWQRANPNGYR
jgi:UDP-glucose 4-epimerase